MRSTDPLDAMSRLPHLGMAPAGAHQNQDGTWDWDEMSDPGVQTTGGPVDALAPTPGGVPQWNSAPDRTTPRGGPPSLSGPLGVQSTGGPVDPFGSGGFGQQTTGGPSLSGPLGVQTTGGPVTPNSTLPPAEQQAPSMNSASAPRPPAARGRRRMMQGGGGMMGAPTPSLQGLHALSGGFGQGGY